MFSWGGEILPQGLDSVSGYGVYRALSLVAWCSVHTENEINVVDLTVKAGDHKDN